MNNKEIVKEVEDTEVVDLSLLGAKARAKLTELIGTMKPIELIALIDRTFQQRRLLQGKSTENVSVLSAIITKSHEQLKASLKK